MPLYVDVASEVIAIFLVLVIMKIRWALKSTDYLAKESDPSNKSQGTKIDFFQHHEKCRFADS